MPSPTAREAAIPVGFEYRVNGATAADQTAAAVCWGPDGFVVAWQSYGQDGDGYGIFARRHDASGLVLGSEFSVSAHTTGD